MGEGRLGKVKGEIWKENLSASERLVSVWDRENAKIRIWGMGDLSNLSTFGKQENTD
jgi:hypothetical protein